MGATVGKEGNDNSESKAALPILGGEEDDEEFPNTREVAEGAVHDFNTIVCKHKEFYHP